MTTWADIQRGIFAGESGGDYGALYGYANRPGKLFSDIDVTGMTINELLDFQDPSGPYAQYVSALNKGVVSTPAGAYQIVGRTLRDARDRMGLTGQERFTPEMQDRIGRWIHEQQGTGAWEGYQGPQGGDMAYTDQPTRGLLSMPEQSPADKRREWAGRAAMAFNTLRQRPDASIPAMIEARRQQRGANRTAEWLSQQPGGEPYAQMAAMGRGAEALAAYQASKTGPEQTAMQKNYAFLISQGYSPEQALRAVQSGSITNISTGTVPPGYQQITDPVTGAIRMEAIPGGPAAAELSEAHEKEIKADELAAKGESTVNRSVDFLVKAIDKKGLFDFPEAGVAGNLLAHLGVNQEAVDFRNELASLQAVIAFDRLQEMRNASKTGGALGAVSEKELTLLINAYGNLMQSTSSDRLKENLLTIQQVMNKIESDPVASSAYYGTPISSSGDGFSVTGVVGQ